MRLQFLPLFLLLSIVSAAQTYTESILYSFPLTANDYQVHPGNLVVDPAGNLYGAALNGGVCGTMSCGTIFKLSTKGVLSTLYNFTGGADGAYPCCLVIDKSANLYGTTSSGALGYGTVFKFATATKKFSTLHQFGRLSTDGLTPGWLTLGSDGNLYGATSTGGAYGNGVTFEVTPNGKESIVYNFTYTLASPLLGNVLRNNIGDLYTTSPGDDGAFLQITPKGVESVLASNIGVGEGCSELQGYVARNSNGNFYGSYYCGFEGAGLWEVNGSDDAVSYYTADYGDCALVELSGPLLFSGGSLYGTMNTDYGQSSTCEGAVYKFSPSTGLQTILYNFGATPTDGAYPFEGVTLDTAGNLYGTQMEAVSSDTERYSS